MSAPRPEPNYSALVNEKNPFREEAHSTDNEDNEDTPRNSGVMIHIVPETSKARWNHIEDLDSFFTRMYAYHQKHGFYVITLDEVFQLGQFAFVVWLVIFATHCIRYPVLFGDVPPITNSSKVTIPDVIVPGGECMRSFGALTWFTLIMTGILLFFRLVRVCYHIAQFWDIKKFFNTALKIEDAELDNLTWHEVQKRVREVQSEQQMCIHKEQLTELDIYHRILRFKNYTVAMMNKNVLPTRMSLPIIGSCGCLSRGLRFNIELILFHGPWSPFENNWHLREEFKRTNKRIELARQLSRQIMWVAIANLILAPFIFFWQVTYISFSYAALLRKEPGVLGSRCWSQYGRLYLRHFNELDHELDARLNRAYEPADRYISSFSSPIMTVIAKNILFICGGILALIIGLTIYSEHVMQVEHVLTIASVLTVVGVGARIFIPNENMIWCPEQLLTTVLAHVHYLPVAWRGLAHTENVRSEFERFFQLKAVYLLTELLSPFVTPFILMYSFRPRAIDIVDFFRNFTVSVVGVGDVCSFAQLDVRKHGNPDWQITQSSEDDEIPAEKEAKFTCDTNQYTQGEHGKTELSLIHFTLTNPEWKMPAQTKHYLQSIRRHALQDLNKLKFGMGAATNATVMEQSLLSFGNMNNEYTSIVHSVLQNHSFGLPAQATMQQRRVNINQVTDLPLGHASNHPYGFEQMLHQNLYDVSTMPTPSILHNIQEGEVEDDARDSDNMQYAHPMSTSMTRSMEKSIRKGASKIEGKIEGSTEGLLYSLYGQHPQMPGDPHETTTADMCFSALFLHEVHHRKMQRRGIRLEQSQRQLWQRPHQQDLQASAPTRTVTTNIAESTPLLGQKRS
ncbi:unnamed protein product [Hermetia illucens]|uniref:Autophagy-related protein 9 n=1 Tax=Hermetia illucens TaxID=343691 RepID=A0A7R8UV63_HERIL|nr:autophagy-related protein 9A [Hermetia illucens]CAD7087628.1 unnamed protein product [Hermetia illucens]